MKSTEKSLLELSSSNSWIIDNFRPRGKKKLKIEDNSLYVSIVKVNNKAPKIPKILIRIYPGKTIIDEMEINTDSRLQLFHHPDDMLGCMLVKAESGNSLRRSNKSSLNLYISYAWGRPFMINTMSFEKTGYIITPKKALVFRIPQ